MLFCMNGIILVYLKYLPNDPRTIKELFLATVALSFLNKDYWSGSQKATNYLGHDLELSLENKNKLSKSLSAFFFSIQVRVRLRMHTPVIRSTSS